MRDGLVELLELNAILEVDLVLVLIVLDNYQLRQLFLRILALVPLLIDNGLLLDVRAKHHLEDLQSLILRQGYIRIITILLDVEQLALLSVKQLKTSLGLI